MKLAIVTACPCGIANSIIAAKLLQKAAIDLHHEISVECHSTVVEIELLTQVQIQEADVVVICTDTAIDMFRFDGKKCVNVGIKDLIQDAQKTLSSALDQAQIYQYKENQDISQTTSVQSKRLVAVTACPTGVAHTYMAAEAIENAAKKRGYWVKVETRGSVGVGNELTAQEIADADVVMIACDIEVDLAKFDGKKLYKTKTGQALKKTNIEIDNAFAQGQIYHHSGGHQVEDKNQPSVYSHLMTGVSHMLPVVVAGGLICALSFVFGIKAFMVEGSMAANLMAIKGAAFGLMIAVLSGYIAYSIADRPGLTPGLVGGMLASTVGAGFIGGIISGFLAGYVAKILVEKVKLPSNFEALKPILIIPFFSTLIVGLLMMYIIGGPTASIMQSMSHFLASMQSGSAIILGLILGAMMCFDLGGPINKAAYTFGVGLLASEQYLPMAAIMAAGMVPPIGIAIATRLASKKFSASEKDGGVAAFILGLCFISEGAIPYAARDPMHVIPSTMIGGALTGALSMFFGCQLMAPHGGLFVMFIPGAISPVFMYLLAIIAGSVVTGVIYSIIRPHQLAES